MTFEQGWVKAMKDFCDKNNTTAEKIAWKAKYTNREAINKCFGENGDGLMTPQVKYRLIKVMKQIDSSFNCKFKVVATYKKQTV
jgi:hypothetical protein